METTATLRHISREQLSSILLSPNGSKVAVVDVRDGDYVGGHIHSSINVPSSSLDNRLPKIIESLADKEIVVFHCALSQQRGPGAALKYLRDRDSKSTNQDTSTGSNDAAQQYSTDEKVQSDFNGTKELEQANKGKNVEITTTQLSQTGSGSPKKQEVFVLDGGFVKWQEKYCSP
ncbi:hypothetical protein MMC07_003121 [Pseudocyphellaria aurata]|nr:hypothetical protein [Pseudocyphellaria aurata]